MSQNVSDHHGDASEDGESRDAVEKKKVQFNENGQPIGVGSEKFATFIGKMARLHCPPTYSDWPHVPNGIKETIWNGVFASFDIELFRETYVLQKANKAWKDWKCNLRKIYDRYPTDVERKKHIPKGMKKEDWEDFVDLTSTDDEQMKRVMGRETRKHMNLPQMSGRRGAARTAEELKKQSSNGKVPRYKVFMAIHASNNGESPTLEEVRNLVSLNPSLEEKDLDNDVVALVCGRDGKGRVRALGGDVSKTVVKASAPFKEIVEKEKRKNEDYDAKFKICMQRLDEETRARKLVEEKFTSFINGSFAFGNAHQGRRHSLSMSNDSSIPLSTRCILKNFKKKNVALGNVYTEGTSSEDSYSIIIDDIFDSTAELYDGDGTFEDISIGDTIKWPKSFVEFV